VIPAGYWAGACDISPEQNFKKKGVSTVALQSKKKNCGNSNISQCNKYNLQEILEKKPKSFKIF
jgi:hypothetical protein